MRVLLLCKIFQQREEFVVFFLCSDRDAKAVFGERFGGEVAQDDFFFCAEFQKSFCILHFHEEEVRIGFKHFYNLAGVSEFFDEVIAKTKELLTVLFCDFADLR